MSPRERQRKAGALSRSIARLNALVAEVEQHERAAAAAHPRRDELGAFERLSFDAAHAKAQMKLNTLQRSLSIHMREATNLCDKLGCWRLKRVNGEWQVFKTVYSETGNGQTEHRVTDFTK